jgi:monofunctional biosynthetic peptidoglycan transglycosylase
MNMKKFPLKRIIMPFSILVFLFVVFQFVYPDVSELKKKNPGKTSFMTYREKEWKREGKNTGLIRDGFL